MVTDKTLDRIERDLAKLDPAARAAYALEVREAFQMTQADFAAFTGTTESTVSRRERGVLAIPDETVRALQFAHLLHGQGLAP
jgi:DNA-binding transcriptional regulator YiaG